MAVSRARMLELVKAQCQLFSTTFNPNRLRLGNKVLRQRLRGPALAAWYPRRTATMQDLQARYRGLDMETWDEDEEDRFEAVQITRFRGKGPPKKKRTAAESRSFKKKN